MTENWQEIKRLFHQALELTEAQRNAFRSQACDGDEELRQCVDSLLLAHENAGDFIAALPGRQN